jgi:hypothetical protein
MAQKFGSFVDWFMSKFLIQNLVNGEPRNSPFW